MTDRLSSRRRRSIHLWPIVTLRVYAGVFFANAGIAKIGGGDFTERMTRFLSANLDEAFGFYRGFVENVVLPNKGLFAALVSWGELAIGIGLILGLATRYAAFLGAFMVVNFWFAKGGGYLDGMNHDAVWLMILLVLGFVPAGRIAGLDDGLADRMAFLR